MAHQRLGVQRALAHGVLQVGQPAAGEETGFDGQGRGGIRLGVHCAAPWRLAGRRGPTPGRTCNMAIIPTAVATEAATNITE